MLLYDHMQQREVYKSVLMSNAQTILQKTWCMCMYRSYMLLFTCDKVQVGVLDTGGHLFAKWVSFPSHLPPLLSFSLSSSSFRAHPLIQLGVLGAL